MRMEELGYDVTDEIVSEVIKHGGKRRKIMKKFEATEVCPVCGTPNNYVNWDVNKNGYVAECNTCKRKMFLCDECQHSDDNPDHSCNWHEEIRNGDVYSCCMRGEYKTDEKEYYYITVYADTTGWYTEEELYCSNMVEIKVPRKNAEEWYREHPELNKDAENELGRDCWFTDWIYYVSDCDQTDDLFHWLVEHNYNPKKEDAIRLMF